MGLDIKLIKNSHKSYTRQIFEQIKDIISKGGLVAGDPLPKVGDLARQLDVKVETVGKAYQALEKRGFINGVTKEVSYIAFNNDKLHDIDLKEDNQSKIIDSASEAKRDGHEKGKEGFNDLKEEKVKDIEIRLIEAIKAAKTADLSLEELKKLLDFLDEEVL